MIVRPVSQTETANLLQFSPSQIIWATTNAKDALVHEGLGDTDAARALDVVIEDAKKHVITRSEVLLHEGQTAPPLLVAADRKVDVTYSRFVGTVETQPQVFGPDSERGRAAQRLMNKPLAMPIASVTNVDRIEQKTLLQMIIAQLEKDYLEDIEILGLTAHFQVLVEDTHEFVRQMRLDARQKALPSRSALEEERKHLQALMQGCVYRILAMCPDPTPEDLELRSKLLEAFAIQNDRITAYNRRNRRSRKVGTLPPEVDVNTGEFVIEVDAPTADAPQPVAPVEEPQLTDADA